MLSLGHNELNNYHYDLHNKCEYKLSSLPKNITRRRKMIKNNLTRKKNIDASGTTKIK